MAFSNMRYREQIGSAAIHYFKCWNILVIEAFPRKFLKSEDCLSSPHDFKELYVDNCAAESEYKEIT